MLLTLLQPMASHNKSKNIDERGVLKLWYILQQKFHEYCTYICAQYITDTGANQYFPHAPTQNFLKNFEFVMCSTVCGISTLAPYKSK